MKAAILLFCLLGSTLSLPMQLNPALVLPPTKLVPDQATLLNPQQPSQVFSSLSLIPLTHMLTLGSDLQLMLPVIVAHFGAQGTILSSEELQGTSQILTGLIFHPLFPGAILPTSQANPDAQNGILPAGQAGANPASQGTPEDPFSTPSGTDDDFAATTPAGIQRGRPTTEETPTGSPKGIQ
ncbi:amelotin isoform X3 [Bubalus bubalis]|uniref:amelotin isoform X3 n=1 Tax=Bubalus bubalis TaxID=89462 RepID=UPI000DBCAA1F|nr:amelotin isoform X3 [Bubalus bubalis]